MIIYIIVHKDTVVSGYDNYFHSFNFLQIKDMLVNKYYTNEVVHTQTQQNSFLFPIYGLQLFWFLDGNFILLFNKKVLVQLCI